MKNFKKKKTHGSSDFFDFYFIKDSMNPSYNDCISVYTYIFAQKFIFYNHVILTGDISR